MLCLLSSGVAAQGGKESLHPEVLSWVFLDSGEPTAGLSPEERARQQAAHLANLTRLAEEGKSLAAGPLGASSKKTRGIVVLTVPVGEKLQAEFAGDPFVNGRQLVARAYDTRLLHGKLHPPVEPFEMVEHVIAMVRCDPDLDDETGDELFAELAAELAGDDEVPLALAAAFPRSRDVWCGVLLFQSPHADRMQKVLGSRELFQSGELMADTFVQYLGRGILKSERDGEGQ